jgi:hypothetical protein
MCVVLATVVAQPTPSVFDKWEIIGKTQDNNK